MLLPDKALPPVERLRAVLRILRDPDVGCEWDCSQTFASIAPYTIEEAYEVAEAIERGDMEDLRDELGDLLLQVVYHAAIAEDQGAFDFDAVAKSSVEKMIRRHPHIFGTGPARSWDAIKAEEKAARRKRSAGKQSASLLSDVSAALPPLAHAAKLQTAAASVGFDWPDVDGAAEKVTEELRELAAATSLEEAESELGDLLFSVVNLSRHRGVDPEAALRHANRKFIDRFQAMEANATAPLAEMTLDELETLWQQVKRLRDERRGSDPT